MLTGEIKRKVDQVWNAFWISGISNPLEVLEQITCLQAARNKAVPVCSYPAGLGAKGRSFEDLRWSRFRHFAPAEMFTVLGDHVFSYLRSLNGITHALRLLVMATCCMSAAHLARAADASAPPACPPTAQTIDAAEATARMRTAQDRGMLWRVEKEGRTSWLYGTIHVAERDWMFPGPATQRALRGVDRIGLEMDLLDPDIVAQLRAAIQPPPGAPALPPALAQRLEAHARLACVGEPFAAMRTEMQVMTLMSLAGRTQGLDPAYGIDIFLAGLARGLGKPVVSLETPAQQMALLLSDDPVKVVKMVDDALQLLERKDSPLVIGRLTRAWAEGRLDELEHYPEWCACLDTVERRQAYDELVVGRNPGLARRVTALHDAGVSVFAAVGVLHMVGPQGLPALLAAQGFRVERVPFAPLRAEAEMSIKSSAGGAP